MNVYKACPDQVQSRRCTSLLAVVAFTKYGHTFKAAKADRSDHPIIRILGILR